ncbi:MAG: RnfABCDGE type electron transport complex subunit G [Ruminococcaceae bacterium]|nr:RnfABCDGE type electron transport complex subunit G [Oscillospiraceae bacterium]
MSKATKKRPAPPVKNTAAGKPAAAAKAPAAAKNTAAARKPAAPQKGGKEINYGEVAKIAAILTAICLVITALLAATNTLTEERIAANALLEKQESCSMVLPAPEHLQLAVSDCDVYIAVSGGDVTGAVITTASKGYGGDVQVMTGIDMSGNITGVRILEHAETPGLGANAEKPFFLGQFVTDWQNGETRPDRFAVTKDGGTIDAVTAATRSSRAVTNAVNSAIEVFERLHDAGALVLPEGYVPPALSAPVSSTDASPSDVTADPDPDNNGEENTVPTVVAGGDQQ